MTAAAPEKPQTAAEKIGIVDKSKPAQPKAAASTPEPASVLGEPIVLWNKKEARNYADRFARDYANLRTSLFAHFRHKGHVALGYDDTFNGFMAYCREKLKLESDPSTVKLQIAAAEVSENVGATVPMVIGRHIAKLPVEQQKAVYDEVVTARQGDGATAKSANEMEEDVRRVVRQRLGVEDKVRATPPVSNTNGTAPPASQEPRTATEAAKAGSYPPESVDELNTALGVAVALLRNWALAWDNEDNPLGDETSKKTEAFLKGFDNK